MYSSFQEIGAVLERGRDMLGLSRQDVAEQLNIRLVYIDAMEKGDFASLPGILYAEGHLRSYGRFLKLDEKALLEAFRSLGKDLQTKENFTPPDYFANELRPPKTLTYVTLALAVFVYGLWYGLHATGNVQAAYQQETPVVADTLRETRKDSSVVILASATVQLTFYSRSGDVVTAVSLRAGDTYFVPEGQAHWLQVSDEKAVDIFFDGTSIADVAPLKSESGLISLSARQLKAEVKKQQERQQ